MNIKEQRLVNCHLRSLPQIDRQTAYGYVLQTLEGLRTEDSYAIGPCSYATLLEVVFKALDLRTSWDAADQLVVHMYFILESRSTPPPPPVVRLVK